MKKRSLLIAFPLFLTIFLTSCTKESIQPIPPVNANVPETNESTTKQPLPAENTKPAEPPKEESKSQPASEPSKEEEKTPAYVPKEPIVFKQVITIRMKES